MSKANTKTISGAGLIILSSFFYASYGIWTKLTGDFFGSHAASMIRSAIVLSILLTIAIVTKKLEPVRLRKNGINILGVAFSAFFIWGPLYYAVLHTGLGVALSVNYACLMISVLVCARFLKSEKFTTSKVVSVVLGLIGLSLYFLPGGGAYSWLGVAAAALSGVATGVNIVFTSKLTYNSLQTNIVSWSTSVCANTLLIVALGEQIPRLSLDIHWFYMLLFAAASVLASWTFIKGLKFVEAGIAGILGLLEIVFGIMFGLIFFDEKLSIMIALGAVLIMLAAVYPTIHIKYIHGSKPRDRQG
jgi:drug/metabolite transporter (DMT)-like permease